ncbi:MAG: hypothetical protein AAGA93_11295 [Actinomycetota bacterium]
MTLVGGGTRPFDRSRLEPGRLAVVGIDLGLMFVVPVAVAASQVERFRLDGADLLVDPADRARLDRLDRGFHRAVELGDHLYVLSGLGWWGALVALVVASWTIVIAVPPAAGGRTPGALLVDWLATRASAGPPTTEVTAGSTVIPGTARVATEEADTKEGAGDEAVHRADDGAVVDVRDGTATIHLITRTPIQPPQLPARQVTPPGSAASTPPPEDHRRRWLGDADDYLAWDTAGGRWRDGGRTDRPAFDELVLPESSLGDGISAVTAESVARAIEPWPGNPPTPRSPG